MAAGDVNGNGRIDLVVGSGPGQRAEVSIIKGTDLQNVSPNGRISAFALLGSLFPLGNTFTKGVNVATGNLKGFGFSDVIVSPSSGQAPRIEVYSPHYAMATHLDFEMIGTFYGYRPDDVNWRALLPAAAVVTDTKTDLCLSFLNPSGISIAYIRAIAMHTRSASA